MLPLLLLCLAAVAFGQQSATHYSTSTNSQNPPITSTSYQSPPITSTNYQNTAITSTNSRIETEDNSNNGNSNGETKSTVNTEATLASLYPAGQTSYRAYQPAAQQRRPIYTAPRQPEVYSYAPYSFNYVAQGDDGSSSREETGDSSGRVVGSYTVMVEDGRRRVVNYIADQDGFRATIDTNEPGTDFQNPASVVFHSAAGDSRSNFNQQQTSYRPTNAYRPRPSRIYSQPAVVRPVYQSSPYRYYDGHGHGHNHAYDLGHNHAYYYHNDHRIY